MLELPWEMKQPVAGTVAFYDPGEIPRINRMILF